MIYPWMFDQYPALAPMKEAPVLLAAKADWPRLYDVAVLERNRVPTAAALYFHDMYVDLDLALETAARVPNLEVWITSEYEHNGLRADGARILDRLFDMLPVVDHAKPHRTRKPRPRSSPSSSTHWLKPTMAARPLTCGTTASSPPTRVRSTALPTNTEPTMLSLCSSSPSRRRPRATSCATRPAVPVPGVERRAGDDGAVERVQLGLERVLDRGGGRHGALDLVAQAHQALDLRGHHLEARLRRVEVGVEGAAERHVDGELAEAGGAHPQVLQVEERRHVEEAHAAHAPPVPAHERLHEAGGGVEAHARLGLAARHQALRHRHGGERDHAVAA